VLGSITSTLAILGLGAAPALADPEIAEPELDEPATSSFDVPREDVVPVPRIPADPARSGRGMLAAGGVLLALGAVGRLAIEGFWAGPARLEPGEPFGQWSIPNIAFFTSFSNVLVVPGLVLTGFGARRHGTWRLASGATDRNLGLKCRDLGRKCRSHIIGGRIGWGLLGGGLGLWAVTRALALPVLHRCETNGCAYGYLESTFWLSLGATVSGTALVGLSAGERRFERSVAVTPMLGPGGRGLAVGGRF
jgi:hypothetical protein